MVSEISDEKKATKVVYNGEISAGSLLVSESRLIGRLLLDNIDARGWDRAILADNILQKRNPASAKRQARLIRKRLDPMPPDLWRIVANGGMDSSIQAVLAAAINHSRLLGDFMDTVVRSNWRTFQQHISNKDWGDFMDACAQIDPHVDIWTNTTRSKLRQVVFRILAEAGYVDNTRSLRLLPVRIIPEIRHCLEKHHETYVLRCMSAANS
jgi:hypothetical protein